MTISLLRNSTPAALTAALIAFAPATFAQDAEPADPPVEAPAPIVEQAETTNPVEPAVVAQQPAEPADPPVEAPAPIVEQAETTDPVEPAVVAQQPVEPAPTAPTLAEIAATDENLTVREGQGEEADSMVMLSDVLFPFGESTLRAEAIETLRGVAPELAAAGPLTLEGHTDDVGDEDFNLALGERRAQAVRDWLVGEGGLNAENITILGVGEADPLHSTDLSDADERSAARALNRRVEFVMN